jgi:uncharacterized protein (DUF2147 family)
MAQRFGEMNKFVLGCAAAIALCAPPAANAADQIYGVWVRDGHPTDKLEFYDCAGKLCAKGIIPLPDGRPPPLILKSAAKTGANSWKGDLFNPEDGKTYTGKISYDSPTQLTLTGCLVAFLCQSETWTRLSGPTKPAAADSKADVKGDAKAKSAAPDAGKAGDKSHEPAKAAAAAGHDAPKPAAAGHDSAKPAAAGHDTPKPAAAGHDAPKPAKPAKPPAPKPKAPPADDDQ